MTNRPPYSLRTALLTVALAAAIAIPGGLAAQAIPALGPVGDSTAVDTVTVEGVTPTGAFLRSVLVPGWGHAAVGSHLRGAFYAGAEGGIGWMLFRIHARLSSAVDQLDLVESDARTRLELAGVTDPEVQEDSLAADESVREARGLVGARQQQREDWIALGIFFVLLGGADAFVSAHLKDFPAEPVFNTDGQGRFELGLRVPLGGGPPRR